MILASLPLIMFITLFILMDRFMTEKRLFSFKDKIILTFGGFVVLLSISIILNEIFFFVASIPFVIHWFLLMLPSTIKRWKEFIRLLRMRYRL